MTRFGSRRSVVRAGVDVTSVARVNRFVTDHAAELHRIFTPDERAFCRGRAARGRYAAAFAAKEAVMKALGTGWRSDVDWSDIDTRRTDAAGGVMLSGGARRVAQNARIARILVSTSITSAYACAMAIAEAEGDAN